MSTRKDYEDLARQILEIMAEEEYPQVEDFSMPEELIQKTTDALQGDKIDEYYTGIIQYYGGYYEREFEKHMTPNQRLEAGLEIEED